MTSLAYALGLALVHLGAARLRFLGGTPRSRWLSLAGGASVAYIFVHLLPEIAETQRHLSEALPSWERAAWLLALAGLALFYGLERRVQRRADPDGTTVADADETASEAPLPAADFWLHIGSFALYNGVVGYLLRAGEFDGAAALATFFAAMALHFLVNDFGLQRHHRRLYEARARWLLAAAVLAGWALPSFVHLPEAALGGLLALLGGAVILNVLKEEVPAERESRFWAFALGAAAYAALLLAA